MARSIVQIGNPVLRAVAQEIPLNEIGSAHIASIIADMKSLLSKEKYGVAVAAPQVGESLRLFVVAGKKSLNKRRKSEDDDEEDDYLAGLPEDDEAFINPILTKTSRKKIDKHEGCLSVRGKWGHVPRAEKATIQAYNEQGQKFERGASGFLAHIFQHEMDHLDGILYVDKATDVYDDDRKHSEE